MIKQTKILAALSAVLLVTLLFAACGGNPPIDTSGVTQNSDNVSDSLTQSDVPTDSTPADTTPKDTTPSDTKPANKYPMRNIDLASNASKLKLLGRTPVTSNGIVAGWSASGFELKADCALMITFNVNNCEYTTTNNNGSLNNCARSEYTVYVDGAQVEVVTFEKGTGTYTYMLPAAGGVHTFRFVRHQYVKNGYTEFTGVQLFGNILDANEGGNAPYIEFIGDSITCGYGLDSTETPNHFDATKAYSYLVAQNLGADYSMVSISGIGLAKSSGQHQVSGVHRNINDFYEKTNFMYSNDKYTPNASQKADLVVINLVTNDKYNSGTEAEVKAAFKTLVSKVRTMHGSNVKILVVCGMILSHGDAANGWIDAAYNELGGESANLYKLYVTTNTDAKDGHPSVAAQAAAAQSVASYIKTKNLV